MKEDIVVIGGGNAGLSAAIEAAEAGNNVFLLEASPEALRGGNTKYTRDIRYVHESDKFSSGEYSKQEFFDDLRKVVGDKYNQQLAEIVISLSETLPYWMSSHGIIFKKAIKGTLNLSKTNAFFLGGGKVLVDTYYKLLQKLGVKILYNAEVISVEIVENKVKSVEYIYNREKRIIKGDKFIFASGGFESNKSWLAEFWGDATKNIKIRGVKFNTGKPLKALYEKGVLPAGKGKDGHMVAVDARGPEFDGGIVHRIDAIPWGIVVNVNGERFYDEGEDIWPKRYAIWGKLIAEQPRQIAYVICDYKTIGKYMPTAYPPIKASTIAELADLLNLPKEKLLETVKEYNSGIEKDNSDSFNWKNISIFPKKSHWAIPIDTPPYLAYPVVPGLTFTYQGVKINSSCKMLLSDGEIENGYAAGEISIGNVLNEGYLAGFGLTFGTITGRISGGWEYD